MAENTLSTYRYQIAFLLLLSGGAQRCFGDITNVRITGVTATQAVLGYIAPDGGACTVEASEFAGYAPLAHDVNATLFPGDNRDNRAGAIATGRGRTFVLGRRAAELAADGRYYSRALQADTDHYYRITCGQDVATGSFHTAVPPFGVYNDSPAAQAGGKYAYPTIDWSQAITPGAGQATIGAGSALCGAYADHYNLAGFTGPHGLTAGDILAFTSGPHAGMQRRVAYAPDATHACLAYGLPSAMTTPSNWGKRTNLTAANDQKIIEPQSGLLMRRITSPQAKYFNDWGEAPSAATGNGWVPTGNTGTLLAGMSSAGDGGAVSYTGDAIRSFLYLRPANSVGAQTTYRVAARQLDWVTVTVRGSGNGSNAADNSVELCLSADGATCRSAAISLDLRDCASADCVVGSEYPVLEAWKNPADAVGSMVGAVEFYGNGGILVRKSTTTANTVSLDYVAVNVGTSSSPAVQWPSSSFPLCSMDYVTQTATGRNGYLCLFGYGFPMYWVDAATADSAPVTLLSGSGPTWGLGWYADNAGANFSPMDSSTYIGAAARNGGGMALIEAKYTGTGTDMGPANSNASFSNNYLLGAKEITLAAVESRIAAFTAGRTPSFDPAKFACEFTGPAGPASLLINCYSGGQDSIGWKAIYDTTAKDVVAATTTHGYYPLRFCVDHTGGSRTDGGGWIDMQPNPMQGGPTCGNGPLKTELAAAIADKGIASACAGVSLFERSSTGGVNLCSTIAVTGDVYDPTPCASENSGRGAAGFLGEIQAARPGDMFKIDSEYVQLLRRNGDSWVVLRGVDGTAIATHASAADVTGQCSGRPPGSFSTSWDTVNDAHGEDATLTYKLYTPSQHGAILESGATVRMYNDSNYNVWRGSVPEIVAKVKAQKPDQWVLARPLFAGATDHLYPDSHASRRQTLPGALGWILDGRTANGYGITQNWSRTSGNLYQTTTTLKRKALATAAYCWNKPSVDISPGPLTPNAFDAYKYCYGAGCYPGASATTLYQNCPDATQTTCVNASDPDNYDFKGLCGYDLGPAAINYSQVDITRDDRLGERQRFFHIFDRYRTQNPYKSAIASHDGKWAFALGEWVDGVRSEVFAVKLPPLPAQENTNRRSYVPVKLQLNGGQNADNAIVEFGYAENGDAGAFYCTSRHESCVAQSDIIDEAQPFYFSTTEAGSVKGKACASGCSITIPALPGRVVYYRVSFRDRYGSILQRLGMSAQATP
jgi:hypothetical protein